MPHLDLLASSNDKIMVASTSPASPSTLLGLPREIRNDIYSKAVGDSNRMRTQVAIEMQVIDGLAYVDEAEEGRQFHELENDLPLSVVHGYDYTEARKADAESMATCINLLNVSVQIREEVEDYFKLSPNSCSLVPKAALCSNLHMSSTLDMIISAGPVVDGGLLGPHKSYSNMSTGPVMKGARWRKSYWSFVKHTNNQQLSVKILDDGSDSFKFLAAAATASGPGDTVNPSKAANLLLECDAGPLLQIADQLEDCGIVRNGGKRLISMVEWAEQLADSRPWLWLTLRDCRGC